MTFLQYVMRQVLGPPARTANRQSFWPCPRCGHDSFGSLPPKDGCKDRFRCHRCGFRGDEYDLLKELHPDRRFPWQQSEVGRMRRDYESKAPTDDPLPPGDEEVPPAPIRRDADLRDVQMAFADFHAIVKNLIPIGDDQATMRLLVRAAEVAELHGIGLDDLVRAVADFLRFVEETDREHVAECGDPECDAVVCRRRRGWTEEEISEAVDRDLARMKAIRAKRKGRGRRSAGPNTTCGGVR